MKISVQTNDPAHTAADLLVVAVMEGTKKLVGQAAALDKSSGGLLADLMAEEKFEGKSRQWAVLRTMGRLGATKVALIGCGSGKFDEKAARELAARAVRKARAAKAKRVLLILPALGARPTDIGRALVEGAMLGDYKFLKYKTKDLEEYAAAALDRLEVSASGKKEGAALEKGMAVGEVYARATVLARGLVNEPSSEVTPASLAETAVAIARANPKRLTAEILDRAEIEKLKMGGLLAVAKGSDHPPKLIHLVYKPAGKPRKRVVVVGKGVTFDSGGLSLKPSASMETMKNDMAGCAAMLGIMSALPALAPNVEVHGIAGVCENMPSGRAMRPGDVVTTRAGKTIEVLNTDAEGRVTLADTLFYGSELAPDYMVDLATLTGACVVALGEEVAGLMGNDPRLTKRLLDAADASGERLWELPLVDLYRDLLKSKIADLKNTAGRHGGAVTAGLFLREFVGRTKWAHLDIAGPAWAERDSVAHQPLGATGFGVRTILHFIEKL
jgi:leucyl aminopeptidase